ncbi:MAG: hypothetical protein QOJ53_213, partial [Sphingomonadales bacterium]|nr:hypothetical protein [Sphingomonadales bacterium]
MTDLLEKDLLSIALCWRLERLDGVALGFTSHDRDLAVGGLVYRAAPGMLPSAIALSDGFDPATLDIKGALTSDAISARDLSAGRWDGAALNIFMTDWEAPGAEILAIARGTLGEVVVRGEGFEAELRGPAASLDAPAVEQTSPECRAQLGDKRCRIDMAARTRITRIAALVDEDVVEVADAAAGNAHGYGRLRWIGGANSGIESAILRSDGVLLTQREPPPLTAAIGDLVEISEGCDR